MNSIPQKVPPAFRCSSASSAFTLRELIVIIAVLGIFLTLGLTASVTDKSKMRIVQCAGNVRQFALAMTLYAQENKGALPASENTDSWPWDLPANPGNILTQWIPSRLMYCPGREVRFTEQDNLALWNFNPSRHIVGYALTAPGSGLHSTNQNRTLIPGSLGAAATFMPAPSPSARVLLADATLSNPGQHNAAARYFYNWTSIPSAIGKPHLSPHLNGKFPVGGNLGMLDGHVEWRKFDDMQSRVSGSIPGFWW
jgi:general secretion pathway protein G